MATVSLHEPDFRLFLRQPKCPVSDSVTYRIRDALTRTLPDIVRDQPFVGALAVDWQDAEGHTTVRVARIGIEHRYDADNPDGDLRQIVWDNLNLAVADWMGHLFNWGRGTGRYMSTVPYFLCHTGSHIPMSVNGVAILTVLSTADREINCSIIRVAEQAFYDRRSLRAAA
jgi:hypothetical protein